MNKQEILEEFILPWQVWDNIKIRWDGFVENNIPGTWVLGRSWIISFMLWMPIWFNKVNFRQKNAEIFIFESLEEFEKSNWEFNFLNIPVWYLEHESWILFIRVFCPRTNMSFILMIYWWKINNIKNNSWINPIDVSKYQWEID